MAKAAGRSRTSTSDRGHRATRTLTRARTRAPAGPGRAGLPRRRTALRTPSLSACRPAHPAATGRAPTGRGPTGRGPTEPAGLRAALVRRPVTLREPGRTGKPVWVREPGRPRSPGRLREPSHLVREPGRLRPPTRLRPGESPEPRGQRRTRGPPGRRRLPRAWVGSARSPAGTPGPRRALPGLSHRGRARGGHRRGGNRRAEPPRRGLGGRDLLER